MSAFLTYLASDRNVAAATQKPGFGGAALSIQAGTGDRAAVAGPDRPLAAPEAAAGGADTTEVRAVLGNLSGGHWLVVSLLYGSGLRLLEVLHLRIKDVDLGQRKLIVRDAKGMKDRVTVLPDGLVEPLRRATLCVTRSQRTCSKQGTTYGPCRSCSGTAMSARHRSTRMC